ncbi:hypothetical protein GGU10DRAFT_381704, partial [Lentinula aff. detonsa]
MSSPSSSSQFSSHPSLLHPSSESSSQPSPSSPSPEREREPITYRLYTSEPDLPHIISLIASELSEPYVIYTFRYFLSQWPHLSFLAYTPESPTPIAVISNSKSKSNARGHGNRGYIAMLSFVDVVEMAVIAFISRIFPIVRLSILSLAEYYVPESCEAISSLFDLLDVQVTNCCGYGLQLRMAAIDQLLQSDETVVATLPKTFNLSLFAEKCRSMMITASDMPSALQLSDFPLADQPANDCFSLFGEISLTSSPSIGQEDPPSPECLYPTWSTPRSSLELLVTGTWIYNSPPSLDVDLDRLIRPAAERELSSCADLLFNSNLQASMQSSILQTSSKDNPLITENAPSPISQTFFLDMKSLSSNLEALESDNPSALDLAPMTIPQDSSRNTAVQDRPLDHHRIPPASLQAHDHSRQSSIDLALVPKELLKPYSTKNYEGPSHRRPLSRISEKFNASSNSDSANE